MKRSTLPATGKPLQRAYADCERRGSFITVDKAAYGEYVQRAQKDLASAERDFQSRDFHWARIKAYQSLFHLLNALLVKHVGYFSKDHGCLLVALMSNNIILEPTARSLRLLTRRVLVQATRRSVYDDIDEFRLQRNFALYKPKAWEEVSIQDVQEELNKVKMNFRILLELL